MVDSYSAKFDESHKAECHNQKTPVVKHIGSPIAPEIIKEHNKTDTSFPHKRKSNSFVSFSEPNASEPNSWGKSGMIAYNDQKFNDSKEYIAFEDSLISGTKIDIQGQKKQIQKQQKEIDHHRRKIDEIQKKYEKAPSQKKAKKKMARGHSYKEADRSKLCKNKINKLGEKAAIGPNVSKIDAKKRNPFKSKKGSEMIVEKPAYKSKRHIEDEAIDEKLNTQTFRFTNQFQSENENDFDYFKEDLTGEDGKYDESIAEEIESKSQDSSRSNQNPKHLRKNNGPIEIPSDTNPFKKKHSKKENPSQVGTPISKPPKMPQRLNSKNQLQSPAEQIFTTKRQKKQDEQK